jgi:hypothetical protein
VPKVVYVNPTPVHVHPVLRSGDVWEVVLALCTFALAIATGILAAKTARMARATHDVAGKTGEVARETNKVAEQTRELAQETGTVAEQTRQLTVKTNELATRTAEDVVAQFRPVVVTGIGPRVAPQEPIVRWNGSDLHIRILNTGNGPALDVQALAQPTGRAPSSWHRAALPRGDDVVLNFYGIEITEERRATVEIEYRGLANDKYRSKISINFAAPLPGSATAIVEDVIVETLAAPYMAPIPG